jgi:hypothetical protein
MKKSLARILSIILGWSFVVILLIFFVQARDYYGPNPIVRKRTEVVEAFASPPATVSVNDTNMNGMEPGDPDLDNARRPYALLRGWLTLAEEPIYKTAQGCREVDFQTRLEKTGNFRQLTNNYKRGDPDSCSGPIEELNLAIYKTTPIPNEGCAQPFVEV